ncbi:MAG: hypothetical protein Q9164_001959 [Protoblastenia rupestris]
MLVHSYLVALGEDADGQPIITAIEASDVTLLPPPRTVFRFYDNSIANISKDDIVPAPVVPASGPVPIKRQRLPAHPPSELLSNTHPTAHRQRPELPAMVAPRQFMERALPPFPRQPQRDDPPLLSEQLLQPFVDTPSSLTVWLEILLPAVREGSTMPIDVIQLGEIFWWLRDYYQQKHSYAFVGLIALMIDQNIMNGYDYRGDIQQTFPYHHDLAFEVQVTEIDSGGMVVRLDAEGVSEQGDGDASNTVPPPAEHQSE